MKDTVRTFLAVDISDAVRRRTTELIGQLDAAGADVKWVESHNRHLTLKFLDEVPLREIPRISEALERAVVDHKAFEIEVHGAGAFPHPGRPRTVWVGVQYGREQLADLAGAIDKALAKLGYRKESRRFEPHLTIGRVRGSGPTVGELGRLLKQHAEFDAGRCRIDEVIVFSSQLTSEGPVYESLSRARLM